MIGLVLAAAGSWLLVLLLPWRPWSTRERIEPADAAGSRGELPESAVGVLIPARNEAATVRQTLESIADQPGVERIVLVDDQSDDDTAPISASVPGVTVIRGQASPPGWSGKLWAQQQGLAAIDSPLVLLLDADIRLAPGMLGSLVEKLEREGLDQVSIMASLPAASVPEKLMLPAFVYFFKQLYPFAWVNRDDRPFAAAAGGCVLVRREALERVGAFEAWKNTLIDDCELAARIRAAGGRIWLGLSHGVESMRRHPDLDSILETIRRTAYTQLKHSPLLLIAVAVVMLAMFLLPPLGALVGVVSARPWLAFAGVIGWAGMTLSFLPQVRFSGLSWGWALTLPVAALLFLYASVASALRHHGGTGARWKGRAYPER